MSQKYTGKISLDEAYVRKLIGLTVFILIQQAIFAGNVIYEHGKCSGSISYVFGNGAVIYEKPSIKSKQVYLPAPGSVITIIKDDYPEEEPPRSDYGVEDDYEDWYEIRINTKKQGIITGHIRAAFMAIAFVGYDFDRDGKNELVLMGEKTDVKNDTGDLQLVYIKNGIVKSELSFKKADVLVGTSNIYQYRVETEIVDSRGFQPPLQLFNMEFTTGTCDGVNGCIYFLWDGKNLQKACDVFVGSLGEEITDYHVDLPANGKVLANTMVARAFWLQFKPADVRVRTSEYKWNGNKMAERQKGDQKIKWKKFIKEFPQEARMVTQ